MNADHRGLIRTAWMLVVATVAVAFFAYRLQGGTGPVQAAGSTPAWQGHANDAQHSGLARGASLPLARVRWQMSLDLHPKEKFGLILEHYGSAVITAANTAIVPVKVKGHSDFSVVALRPSDGTTIWTESSGFRIPPPHFSQTMFAPFLTRLNTLVYAGPGGTIYIRQSPDSPSGARVQHAFYGDANYRVNRKAYDDALAVDTPITVDGSGAAYFGYRVFKPNPIGLRSGIARVAADGTSTWVDASSAAGDKKIDRVQSNGAPALSLDGKTVYVSVSNGGSGYLLGLDTRTLRTKYRVQLMDPQFQRPAGVVDYSSAAPSVGPDGDVFIGVLSGGDGGGHNGRGWLLHFDSTLTTQKTPGSFGWDDTASIVPSKSVPSYKGSSPYLLLTKYNNYLGDGSGDGENRMAVLDPEPTQTDRYSGVTVMLEVITVLGPTHVPGEPPNAVYEWCVNSVAVDPATKSALVNSEDGNAYRWSFKSNSLTEKFTLGPPNPEAYTPTVIGPDGSNYVMSGAELFALGN